MWCTECGKELAVTKDGRHLCRKCLKKAINHENPMTGCYKGMYRTADHKQASDGDSPWMENAVRDLESSE